MGFTIPVVHEHVRLPQPTRWDSDVANISVLRLVPLHVDVIPLLQNDHELFGVVFLFLAVLVASNAIQFMQFHARAAPSPYLNIFW